MSGVFERAKTLAEASLACDVRELEGETLERYYVALESRRDVIALVSAMLKQQKSGQFPKLLLTGHIGCGKSSELSKIAQRCQEHYHIVFVKAEEGIRVEDLEYTDLYLLIIQSVEKALRSLGLAFDPILQSDFENWFKTIIKETENSLEGEIGLSAETSGGLGIPFIAKLLFKATSQIKGGAKQTTKIRDELRRDFGQLKTNINLLLNDGSEQIKTKFPEKQGFLIIIDGLDKCPKELSTKLFFDCASQLQDLSCTIIYTVPIGSLYTPNAIGRSFENPRVIPMVNIYSYKGDRPDHTFDPDADFNFDGLKDLEHLVARRIELDAVFESREQLMTLCKASGGHLRFLMQMLRTTCLIAQGREHLKVQDRDVEYAIKDLQFRFEREIPPSCNAILAKIALAKQKVDDEISPTMLYITAVLEYNGENRWIYPNPVVRRSQLFLEALQHEQQHTQS
jgi:AAA ATPase domain